MSCRRIRRELLWLVRFGDFDAGSAPHLEHLASCQDCRDEVGLDRALVRQLRTALAARIGDATPSPSAWEGVLARMRQPEPRVARPWTSKLAAFLRAGSAMAGASLALCRGPEPRDCADRRSSLARRQCGDGERAGRAWIGTPSLGGPRAGRGRRPRQRGIGLGRLGANRERAAAAGSGRRSRPRRPPQADAEPTNNFVVRVIPVDMGSAASSSGTDDPPQDEPAVPAATPVGEPS